jgi:hypothetical protein
MAVAIDAKPSKQRFDQHPRLKRLKPKPAPLQDEAEARLLIADEKTFRETLFRDFVKFCRDHGAYVVSVPWHSPARVLVPPDGETSALEIALARLPKYRVVQIPAMAVRLSHGVFSDMRQIEVTLWRGS